MTTAAVDLINLNNGVRMPALGLGVFQSPPEETVTAVEAAIQSGYRLLDTAAAYMNEREVGEGIRRSGIDRSEVFVTTKLWISDYGYEPALRGVNGCLRRLNLDYVDLFLLHHPVPSDFDATVAAYKATEKMLADGRARAIGVSNFSPLHLQTLTSETNIVPAVNQVELHPFFTQQALRDFHAANGIVTQAWSPLGGVNVYSAEDGSEAKNPLEHPTILELASRYGKTPAQVVLRWHIQLGVSAIPKSVKPHRIAENIEIFDFALTPDEVTAIDALDTGARGGPDPELVDTKRYPFKVANGKSTEPERNRPLLWLANILANERKNPCAARTSSVTPSGRPSTSRTRRSPPRRPDRRHAGRLRHRRRRRHPPRTRARSRLTVPAGRDGARRLVFRLRASASTCRSTLAPVVVHRCAFRLVGASALVMLASSCTGEQTRVDSGVHTIVFASDRGLPPKAEEETYDTRRLDLYVMDASGRNVRRLTRNFATDVFPCVSRDGKRIAFTRDIGGYAQVFVMDSRGRHVRMLTHGRANSGLPAWSPDGRRIAFATDRNSPEDGDEIYVMEADGSGQRPVTRNLHSIDDAWPSWAPDGERLVFARETPRDSAIYVVNVDGSGLRRLTRDERALDTQPAWSPDGKEIVYESDIFMLPGQIFVMHADGTARRQLTDPTIGASSRPSWSRDGKRIVFMASRRRHTDIWTMRADGTHKRQLTREEGFDGFPAAG